MRPDRRQESTTLAIALLASLLVWNLPFGGYVLYPFKLLATWMHELSHGLAMTACGAGFDHILVYRDTSGLAYARSSVGAFGSGVIAAAGYMGTPVWGALLLVTTHDARTARRALGVLAALLILTALFVVAPTAAEDKFGPYAIGAIGGVVLLCALLLPARWRLFGAHFLAAQACCNALLDIRVLLRPSQVVGGKVAGASDAHNMAAATFGTTDTWAVWTWAILWLLWSLAVLFVALRVSGSRAARIAARNGQPTASPRDGSDRDERRRSPATAPDRTDPSEPAGTAGSSGSHRPA
ncbi:MAG: M50 family metallopeptidase [Deltaproteobacteria bacterium]|nr:M50 family metallopeptidase [Deltaproteobacteria bacterium]